MKALTGGVLAAALRLLLRLSARRAGVAVVYHAIDVRQGDAARELLPPLAVEHFRRQMRHLSRHYRLVTADEFHAAVAARRRGGRLVACVTFDDDSVEHVRHALPVLAETGVRATFFLNGSFLDGGHRAFWWLRLQRALDGGASGEQLAELLGIDPWPGTVHAAGQAIERLPPRRRDEVAELLLQVAGPDPEHELMTADEARSLVDAGHAVGFHTRRHYRLPTLDDEQLARELREGRAELEAFAGARVTTIAYPHGHADERIAAAAREAGLDTGFLFEPGATTPDTDALRIPRFPPGPTPMSQFAWDLVRPML